MFAFFSCSCLISGCQNNPATGKNEFNLMSTDEEDKIGKKEHKKVLEQFGGEYNNVKLNNYINSLGKISCKHIRTSRKRIQIHCTKYANNKCICFARWIYLFN